ncbi:MAG: DUF4858 domain-containing protein [Tannerella sp.]|jgi:hypothetical protein|nr:DUF4858 domain-containing protein [Tannerella sp.]
MKHFVFVIFMIVSSLQIMNAQSWSKEDSLWLQNYLEGREPLKLNEETLKAIEEGKLIVPSWMKDENGNVRELIRDLDDAAALDSTYQLNRLDPLSMPPAVFALYVLYMDKVDSINASGTIMLSEAERNKLQEAIPPGERTIYIGNLGTGAPPGILFGGSHDFNHALSMIFSSTYRQQQKNRKNANAYKFYNDEGAMQPSFKLSEQEKRRLNNAVNNKRVNVKIKTSPNTLNGIDD